MADVVASVAMAKVAVETEAVDEAALAAVVVASVEVVASVAVVNGYFVSVASTGMTAWNLKSFSVM